MTRSSYAIMRAAIARVDFTDVRSLRLDTLCITDMDHLLLGTDEHEDGPVSTVLVTAENVETLVLATTYVLSWLDKPHSATGQLLFPRLMTIVLPIDEDWYYDMVLERYLDARSRNGMTVPSVQVPFIR